MYFLNGIFNIALAVYPILTIQHAVYRFWQYKKSMLLTQILLMNNCKRISNDYIFEYYFCGFEYDIKSFVLENSKLLSTSSPPWLFWYNVYMYQYIFTGSNWKTCITFSLPFMALGKGKKIKNVIVTPNTVCTDKKLVWLYCKSERLFTLCSKNYRTTQGNNNLFIQIT